MSHKVFISYAAEDKATADRVCSALEKAGFKCWIAPRDIDAGTNLPAAIVNGIQTSRAFVLVLSSHADASPHVKSEVKCAFDNGIAILPFRIENQDLSSDLQYFLSTVQWLEAWDGSMDAHLAELVKAISDELSGATGSIGSRRRGSSRALIWTAASLAVIVPAAYIGGYLMRTEPGSIPVANPVDVRSPAAAASPPLNTLPDQPGGKKPITRQDAQTYVWIPPGRF